MKKILDLKDIKLCSINAKYITRGYVLSSEYRKYKELIQLCCNKSKVYKGKIELSMKVTTYKDIDAFIKPTLDGLECIIGNDRNVLKLTIEKTPGIRGRLESIKVFAKEIE